MNNQPGRVVYHPVANLFPLMEGRAFEEFAEDVAMNGLKKPIAFVWEGPDRAIVDGRNRYRACLLKGVKPCWALWDHPGSLIAWVMSENLHRRHLSESDRAILAAEAFNLMEAEEAAAAGRRPATPKSDRTQEIAAEAANVSRRLLTYARRVLAHGSPALIRAVRDDRIAVSRAAGLCNLTHRQQDRALARPNARPPKPRRAVCPHCRRPMR
jgi:ParB-like chromosome segregation protein Spo0J